MSRGDIDTYYEDGQWKNRPQGNERASSTFENKSEAQAKGRDMSIERGVEHFVRNMDGTIAQRNTYPRSRDPRESKG